MVEVTDELSTYHYDRQLPQCCIAICSNITESCPYIYIYIYVILTSVCLWQNPEHESSSNMVLL